MVSASEDIFDAWFVSLILSANWLRGEKRAPQCTPWAVFSSARALPWSAVAKPQLIPFEVTDGIMLRSRKTWMNRDACRARLGFNAWGPSYPQFP
jgi:hypothetical protein